MVERNIGRAALKLFPHEFFDRADISFSFNASSNLGKSVLIYCEIVVVAISKMEHLARVKVNSGL